MYTLGICEALYREAIPAAAPPSPLWAAAGGWGRAIATATPHYDRGSATAARQAGPAGSAMDHAGAGGGRDERRPRDAAGDARGIRCTACGEPFGGVLPFFLTFGRPTSDRRSPRNDKGLGLCRSRSAGTICRQLLQTLVTLAD